LGRGWLGEPVGNQLLRLEKLRVPQVSIECEEEGWPGLDNPDSRDPDMPYPYDVRSGLITGCLSRQKISIAASIPERRSWSG